jgi:phage gp36-like protein
MSIRTTTILDRIGVLIPGYSGYNTRDEQRRTDKQLREHIALRLEETERFLNDMLKGAVKGEIAMNILELEECRKACSTISAKIRFATYGASALFDKEQIKEKELQEIYRFDEQLLDQVNHIQLLQKQEHDSNFINAALRSKLKEIERILADRTSYIQFNERI